ncbi:MAG: nitrous oxide reductase family maturation protein NosD [Tepidiformaceae bacterium]
MNTTTRSLRDFSPARSFARVRHGHLDWAWTVSALAAASLLFAAYFVPLWKMRLLAPQYPRGLDLTAFGTRMEGDLNEINGLNHYIGVRAIEPDSILELTLFPFVLFPVVAIIAVAAFLTLPRWGKIVLAVVAWAFPIGLLVDMQFWLYTYGHDLNPQAAVRIDPFTPKVVGGTQVMNFHSQTNVELGFWFMLAAAIFLTFGPFVIRFLSESWRNTESGHATARFGLPLAVLAMAGSLVGAPRGHAAESTSIREMIDAAEPGTTIVVPSGHYEGQIIIDKPLTIIGEGLPIIDGGGVGDVVVIEATDVTLRGFIVQHTSRDVSGEPSGIRVKADRATVEGNILRDVLYGLVLQDSGWHTVRGNSVTSMMEFAPERRGHAIYLWHTTDNLISGNHVDGAKDGVFVGFGLRNTIEDNVVTNVRYGIHYMYADDNVFRRNIFRDNLAGAALMYSRRLVLEDNEFSHNTSAASGYGLLMKDVDDVRMRGNQISQNRIGLTFEGAPLTPGSTVVLDGNFIGNNQVALELFTNTDITFTGNTFSGNLRQVQSAGGDLSDRNAWSLDGRGNYWDDYRGYDADGDGVGDRPYQYAGTFNDLAQEEPALLAFAFTPAQAALDLAANWFAAYEPKPVVFDDYPLMKPTLSIGGERSWAGGLLTAIAMMPLVLIPFAVFRVARRTFAKPWAPC